MRGSCSLRKIDTGWDSELKPEKELEESLLGWAGYPKGRVAPKGRYVLGGLNRHSAERVDG